MRRASVGSSTTILPERSAAIGFTTVIDASIAAGGKVRDHIFRVGVNYRFGPEPIVGALLIALTGTNTKAPGAARGFCLFGTLRSAAKQRYGCPRWWRSFGGA